MATHSSILVWRIPWTEEPGGLQSMRSQRLRHDWAMNTFNFHNFMGNRWGNSGNSVGLYFSGLQNHCRWSHQKFFSTKHEKAFYKPPSDLTGSSLREKPTGGFKQASRLCADFVKEKDHQEKVLLKEALSLVPAGLAFILCFQGEKMHSRTHMLVENVWFYSCDLEIAFLIPLPYTTHEHQIQVAER